MQELLNQFWEAKIASFQMDLIKGNLTFILDMMSSGIITTRRISFLCVDAFLYLEPSTEDINDSIKYDRLTTIVSLHFSDSGILNTEIVDIWKQTNKGTFNFAVELEVGVIYIASRRIKIDDAEFTVHVSPLVTKD